MNDQRVICPVCKKDRPKEKIVFSEYAVFACSECGLSFGVPKIPVTISSFNNYPWTREWTENYPKHLEKARYSLAGKLEIISRLSGKSVSSMLDVGCGNGAFLAAAEKLKIYSEGTDIDSEHVRFAKAQGLRAFLCDISEYDTDRQFDFIHIKESFHLVTNTKEFVERVASLMHEESILYLDSTHADGLAACFRKLFVKPPRYGQLYPPLHNRTFNRKSLTYVMEKAGLRILKFVNFNKGDPLYCPSRHFSVRRHTINPLLDTFFLGGFIGCFAKKGAP